MHTLATLMEDLKASGIDPKGTLMVHSSMKAIGEVEGRGETVIEALVQYMKDGLLLFPTHTWDDWNNPEDLFDPTSEKSCVGILTNIFWKREDTIRSLHPSHSVAAAGTRAKEYTDKDRMTSYTPCPKDGCFGSLYAEDAQILFLGAPLTTNTYLHSVEEWVDTADRINPETGKVKIRDYDGTVMEVVYRGHKSSRGDVSQNYDKIQDALVEQNIAQPVMIGDAKSYVVKVRPMTDYVLGLLKKRSNYFDDKN